MCTFNEDEIIDQETYGTPNSPLLKKVREAGFKPIAITVVLCEETFIFKGKAEAEDAAEKFLPEGWWYDFHSWEETREEYIKKFYDGDDDAGPTVYWLDPNFAPKGPRR
jgi:hypothetical protein